MGEGSKSPKPTDARFALAENVKRLLEVTGQDAKSVETGLRAMGYEDFSYKTVERMCNPYYDSPPNLGSIEAVADFFRTTPSKLLERRPFIRGSEPRRPEPPVEPAAPRQKKRG